MHTAPNQTVLEFQDISKSFFGVRALQEVSFGLNRGEILGLIGENGAGKTTLMNILGGVLPPDAGRMELHGRPYAPGSPSDATEAGIAFIHQELNLFTNLSIADNIFIDNFPVFSVFPVIQKQRARTRAGKLLQAVDLDIRPDTIVEELSPGERQLVEIAGALGTGAEIIIFDEPTTSLTNRETDRLFSLINQLKSEGKSIIYISHELDEVRDLADRVVILRDGELVGSGPISDFPKNRMISLMVGRDIDRIYPARTGAPGTETILQVQNLSQSGIVRDISFQLHTGEILGFFGLMGSGRTELMRMVYGLEPYEQGTVIFHGRPQARPSPVRSISQGVAFVTENRREEGLLMEASVIENAVLVSLPKYAGTPLRMVDTDRVYSDVESVIDSLRIKSGPPGEHLAKNLSGGNQQKVVIGKWLLAEPSIFIMDEPTRGIDIGAKYEVYSIMNDLAAKGNGIIFVSSEIEELIGICDRIITMSNGEVTGTVERQDFDKERILAAAFGKAGEENGGRKGRAGGTGK